MTRSLLLALALMLALPLSARARPEAAPASTPLILETRSRYPVAETVERIQQAAAAAGWKVSIVHDLQESLRKAGKEVPPVKILELCKPTYSYPLLARDETRLASAMMPCRISVYQKSDGKAYVARLNAAPLAGAFGAAGEPMRAASEEAEKLVATVVEGAR